MSTVIIYFAQKMMSPIRLNEALQHLKKIFLNEMKNGFFFNYFIQASELCMTFFRSNFHFLEDFGWYLNYLYSFRNLVVQSFRAYYLLYTLPMKCRHKKCVQFLCVDYILTRSVNIDLNIPVLFGLRYSIFRFPSSVFGG